jgi:integrase
MYQRGRHYYADFYAGGRRVRKKLATDLDAAKDILVELRSRANKADFDLVDNDYPLGQLRDQYLRHCEQTLGAPSELRYRQSLDRVLPNLPVRRVRQLTAAVILTYRQERLAEGVCPGTVNYEVGVVHRMLRWGTRNKIIGSSPLDGLRALPHLRPRDGRALDPGEVTALLAAAPEPWRDIWYAYLVTGARLSELIGLTFDDIDKDSRELIVRAHKAKGRRERRIPIDDGLWAILERQEAGRSQRRPSVRNGYHGPLRESFSDRHVFVSTQATPLSRSYVHHCLQKHCQRAGIPTQTFDADGQPLEHVDVHSLRRTFATELIVNGADPKSVQELLGHKTLAMTMKQYAKVRPQNKRQAVGKLSYGKGISAPEHVLPYAAVEAKSVQFGRNVATDAISEA